MKKIKPRPTGIEVILWGAIFLGLSAVVQPDYLIFVWVIIPALYALSRTVP